MVADLVELTRQAFEHEKARWDSVKDTHISGRNRHAVWRAMEETKFEYAKSMLDKALEEGVLEFFGKARGKEVYTNRKMINAFTQEGTGKSQMREYQPGSLFFIVEKFHTDPVHDKYTIVYTDGALKPEDHKIWSLIPWKKQRKRVLHTVTHNVDGINRQDAAYGNLMFLFGAMHLLYSYGRDLLNPPKTSADFYAGMLLYGLDAVLAI
ncbi:TPA: hypothetical protein HA246_03790 [Candidatus Woesearchaeota archaeon]|nr:hypothetical protein [Candidatus Woesearchaeota archaeon]